MNNHGNDKKADGSDSDEELDGDKQFAVQEALKGSQIKRFIICLLACGCLLLPTCKRKSNQAAAILSDTGGPIQLVVCSAASARKSSLRNAELVTNIVNGLPANVHFLILVNDRSAFQATASDRHVTFLEIPEAESISIWPQDPFVVLTNDQKTQLLVPNAFDREDDRQMASTLSRELQLEIVKSELDFEGGNIVVDEEVVFVGFDTIDQNATALKTEHADIQSRFERELGRPVVIVGKSKQAIGHIDMIITPLAGNKVAVADSRWGALIIAKELNDRPEKITRFERRCEKEFFGRAGIDRVHLNGGGSINRPSIVGSTGSAVEFSESIANELDEIADQIAASGCKVVRIPALIPNQASYVDENGHAVPRYPFLTYNNVLLETSVAGNQQVVYLPQYGLSSLDVLAIASWKKLGYEVRPIRGFAISSMYGGSLRCCTKVLMRQK